MTDSKPRYIGVVNVAKLVKGSLKKTFPGVTFSVRSNRYAGGASVHVTWKDGPQESEVNAVVSQYEGSRIDGDYSPRPVTHYLRPDGQAMVAYNPASYAVGTLTDNLIQREEDAHFNAQLWMAPCISLNLETLQAIGAGEVIEALILEIDDYQGPTALLRDTAAWLAGRREWRKAFRPVLDAAGYAPFM